MQITRDDFDGLVASAMDEVALLVLACQDLHKAKKTFVNADELDAETATPDAVTALQICREIASDLLTTATWKQDSISKGLLEARQEALAKIPEAIDCIRRLAEAETSAMLAAGASGNWLRKRVLTPLVTLQEVWAQSVKEAQP